MVTRIIKNFLLTLPVFLYGTLSAQLQENAFCPMFHNDPLHTGRSPCVGPDNPEVKWSRSLGTSFEMSSPIIGDDATYILVSAAGYFTLSSLIILLNGIILQGTGYWNLLCQTSGRRFYVYREGNNFEMMKERETVEGL